MSLAEFFSCEDRSRVEGEVDLHSLHRQAWRNSDQENRLQWPSGHKTTKPFWSHTTIPSSGSFAQARRFSALSGGRDIVFLTSSVGLFPVLEERKSGARAGAMKTSVFLSCVRPL